MNTRTSKLNLILLSILIPLSAYADISQDPSDLPNRGNAELACAKLGADCANHLRYCETTSSMPFSCLSGIYFELEVAKERCGVERYMECYEENNKYKKKWMQELNIPNIGNPKRNIAFQECGSVGQYHVKNDSLSKYELSIISVYDGVEPPFYTDYKKYYECFKEHLK